MKTKVDWKWYYATKSGGWDRVMGGSVGGHCHPPTLIASQAEVTAVQVGKQTGRLRKPGQAAIGSNTTDGWAGWQVSGPVREQGGRNKDRILSPPPGLTGPQHVGH